MFAEDKVRSLSVGDFIYTVDRDDKMVVLVFENIEKDHSMVWMRTKNGRPYMKSIRHTAAYCSLNALDAWKQAADNKLSQILALNRRVEHLQKRMDHIINNIDELGQ